jgi:hypothetical protein
MSFTAFVLHCECNQPTHLALRTQHKKGPSPLIQTALHRPCVLQKASTLPGRTPVSSCCFCYNLVMMMSEFLLFLLEVLSEQPEYLYHYD